MAERNLRLHVEDLDATRGHARIVAELLARPPVVEHEGLIADEGRVIDDEFLADRHIDVPAEIDRHDVGLGVVLEDAAEPQQDVAERDRLVAAIRLGLVERDVGLVFQREAELADDLALDRDRAARCSRG